MYLYGQEALKYRWLGKELDITDNFIEDDEISTDYGEVIIRQLFKIVFYWN